MPSGCGGKGNRPTIGTAHRGVAAEPTRSRSAGSTIGATLLDAPVSGEWRRHVWFAGRVMPGGVIADATSCAAGSASRDLPARYRATPGGLCSRSTSSINPRQPEQELQFPLIRVCPPGAIDIVARPFEPRHTEVCRLLDDVLWESLVTARWYNYGDAITYAQPVEEAIDRIVAIVEEELAR